jgi:hypothetical protein
LSLSYQKYGVGIRKKTYSGSRIQGQKGTGSWIGSATLLLIRFNSGFESVSDEDLSGESSTDGEEGKGGGALPRRKLTKISDRDLSELKSDDGVTFLHFPFSSRLPNSPLLLIRILWIRNQLASRIWIRIHSELRIRIWILNIYRDMNKFKIINNF